MTKIIVALAVFLTGTQALAQEAGFSIGFHNATADSKVVGSTAEAKVGFRLGVPMAFELVDKMKFKTGFIYSQRFFDVTSGLETATAKFEYVDIPALAQFRLNEMLGFFGGLTMALNIGKNIEGSSSAGKATSMQGIVPLATVGVTTLFNDMIGFDFYYERSLAKISRDFDNYSIFGANFVYWVY